ncbi:hypothetical protein KQX54_014908 [Cotesia glomerata]|uniref:Uncharacterized protein n=1 Tax=Cotesia glomerata TaxID=32391 RepID=A0AAV7I8Z9_COTGL|nr:hypothetical protein KQX54_014908 [Cotesia glomerata]
MAVGKPAPRVTDSSIQVPNIRMSYKYINKVQTQRISYNISYSQIFEGFPTDWIAEFINPVQRPFVHVSDLLLTAMDNRSSWTLKPNPNRKFDTWNVQIRIPKKWRSSHSMGENYMDSNGAITATYILSPSSAGTEVIQSHFGVIYNPSCAKLG